jgi:hypothetical protein
MARSEVEDFVVSRSSRIASSEDGPAVAEAPPGRQGHTLNHDMGQALDLKLHDRLHTSSTLLKM